MPDERWAASYGVDLNPFAAAIARFRLAVAALRATGFTRLADAPAFPINVAVGDSLLGGVEQGALFDGTGAATFHYRDEDIAEHPGILQPGRYHVVVGNPPYITVKDKALNEAYRVAYPTCKGKYALSVPFMELFFRLAVRGAPDQPAGFVGQITSNSFMKREFGSKVIESLLSGTDVSNPVDLLDVIDTSGAYIPGHGTPTVILVGRRRRPSPRPYGPCWACAASRASPATPPRAWSGPRSSSTSTPPDSTAPISPSPTSTGTLSSPTPGRSAAAAPATLRTLWTSGRGVDSAIG